jgi:hypothetical protein
MRGSYIAGALILVILVFAGGYFLAGDPAAPEYGNADVVDFESCVAAGYPVMESYPERCATPDGKHFTRDVGNELEKADRIRLDSPRPGDTIPSPLPITGQARGTWFFEASFPITLTNWDGRIIAEGYATAEGEWMTEEFVPFTATLTFESPYREGDPDFMKRGTLILHKDNPSGLPEHDDALEIPVRFAY